MCSHTTYLKFILIPLVCLIIPTIVLAFLFEPISGDLTRLGCLTENDFGWNLEQPAQNILPNPTSGVPEILVIGDSFSYGNVWQSYISEKIHVGFLTIKWDHFMVDASCTIKQVLKEHPSIDKVIFESVEHGALDRIAKLELSLQKQCQKGNTVLQIISSDHAVTQTTRDKTGHVKDPLFLFKTFFNQLKTHNDAQLFYKTYSLALKRHDLFSNRKSTHGLFYKNEIVEKSRWTPDAIDAAIRGIQVISDHLDSMHMKAVFLVIPDKSTTYSAHIIRSDMLPKNNFWQKAQATPRFISVLKAFESRVSTQQDLYFPNDTHLSTAGYKFLGDTLANELSIFHETDGYQ